MHIYTTPILKEIEEADCLLIKVYKQVSKQLKKQGNVQYKKFIGHMVEAMKHRKSIRQEIATNERESGSPSNAIPGKED